MTSFRRAAFLSAALAALTAVPAMAQEEPYLDDRSSAAALIRSLYNAINRHEFARAWDYFGEDKPAKNFQAFIDGYKDTQRVAVLTGNVSEEGAAGSIFYEVPVAIQAIAADGSETLFGGCYSARLAQPAIQDPPFRAMHIEKGALKPSSEGSIFDALPKSCGDAPPATEADTARDKAMRAFRAAYENICQSLGPIPGPGDATPEVFEIAFRYSYETETDPERTIHLVQFPCNWGAYNFMQVYYTVDQYGETQPLSFATPELDIKYENDDSDGKVKSITIIGYTGEDQLVNSEYDPDQKALFSYSKWRGIGDASSTGKWAFRDGHFSLVKYDVDASYDGEAAQENVLDFDTGP